MYQALSPPPSNGPGNEARPTQELNVHTFSFVIKACHVFALRSVHVLCCSGLQNCYTTSYYTCGMLSLQFCSNAANIRKLSQAITTRCKLSQQKNKFIAMCKCTSTHSIAVYTYSCPALIHSIRQLYPRSDLTSMSAPFSRRIVTHLAWPCFEASIKGEYCSGSGLGACSSGGP